MREKCSGHKLFPKILFSLPFLQSVHLGTNFHKDVVSHVRLQVIWPLLLQLHNRMLTYVTDMLKYIYFFLNILNTIQLDYEFFRLYLVKLCIYIYLYHYKH